MEDITYSLQKLQLHSRTYTKNTQITKGTLIQTCLQLYHENDTLKKEIQRLINLRDHTHEPKIPKWVH